MTYTTHYDDLIRDSKRRYWSTCPDWRYIKAELIAESNLDPTARNPLSSAQGIAQFMPPTWDDMVEHMRWSPTASPYDPTYAIPACADYLDSLWSQWSSKRTVIDRLSLTWASYNYGLGNVLRVQRLQGGAMDYATIARGLPKETVDYVERIKAVFAELVQAGYEPG